VPRVFEHLRKALAELFPDTADVPVTHTWGGPIGVPRDWCASVTWDGHVGTAGGYVGDGLSTTNLAGRTLADLVRGESTELTGLPWVNHRSPDWEPEPLRFLGANGGLLATDLADREERLTGRSSLAARVRTRLTGH
jgi:glycine/D-amino acid oxidase-like deaminating enzyme